MLAKKKACNKLYHITTLFHIKPCSSRNAVMFATMRPLPSVAPKLTFDSSCLKNPHNKTINASGVLLWCNPSRTSSKLRSKSREWFDAVSEKKTKANHSELAEARINFLLIARTCCLSITKQFLLNSMLTVFSIRSSHHCYRCNSQLLREPFITAICAA